MTLILIDWQNTLCSDLYWRSLPAEEYQAVQQLLFGADTAFVMEWMRGRHCAKEVNTLVAEHIDYDADVLWKLFVSDCQKMHVNRELLLAIQALRESAEHDIALVTDNMDSFTYFTAPALGLYDYFDAIYNSADVGRLKCDISGQTFIDVFEEFGVYSEDSVLVDDSDHSRQTFEALGGTVLQPKNPSETPDLLKSLIKKPA